MPSPGARARGPTGAGSGRARLRRLARILIGAAAVAILAWIILSTVSATLAGYLWFSNVGFGDVWGTQFTYGVALFVAGLVVGAAVLLASLLIAWHLANDPTDATVAVELRGRRRDRRGAAWLAAAANLPRRSVRGGLVVLALALAALLGLFLAGAWQTVALWMHRVPYATTGSAVTDPSFGLDLGWWMFSLPFLHLAANLAAALLLATLLLTGAAYGLVAVRGADVRGRGPRLHLALLGGLLLGAVAAMQWIGRYDLAYAQNGFVVGVTAADSAVRLPLAALTTASTIAAAVGLVALTLAGRPRLARRAAIAGGTWYVALLLAGAVLPVAYQKLFVAPSQNLAEAPYIANNIALTRRGFALDTWTLASDTARSSLTATDVSNDQATFDNARLWDPSPLACHARSASDRAPVLHVHVGQHRSLHHQRPAHGGHALGTGDGQRQHVVDRVPCPLHPWVRAGDAAGQCRWRGRPAPPDHPEPARDPVARGSTGHATAHLLRAAAVDLGPRRREEQRVRLPVNDRERQRHRHALHRECRARGGFARRAPLLGLEPG